MSPFVYIIVHLCVWLCNYKMNESSKLECRRTGEFALNGLYTAVKWCAV